MVTSLNNRSSARDVGYEMMQYISARLTMSGTANLPVVRIGTVPAGAIIVGISNTVITAITGGTPVLGVSSVAAGGAVPAVGTTSNVNAPMSEAQASEWLVPLAGLAGPLTVDTDFYVGTSGGATAGDAVIAIYFIKPLN
jgi:hypothetical protein